SFVLAAEALGTGYRVSSADTVPFCLFSLVHHLDDYESAFWATVAGLGDRDTTCAIVGGIVALRAEPPVSWVQTREALPGEID
ncbi:MAG: ADP-ribosylglycohydrolase family protein, partial [Myxococcales bacterium]